MKYPLDLKKKEMIKMEAAAGVDYGIPCGSCACANCIKSGLHPLSNALSLCPQGCDSNTYACFKPNCVTGQRCTDLPGIK